MCITNLKRKCNFTYKNLIFIQLLISAQNKTYLSFSFKMQWLLHYKKQLWLSPAW